MDLLLTRSGGGSSWCRGDRERTQFARRLPSGDTRRNHPGQLRADVASRAPVAGVDTGGLPLGAACLPRAGTPGSACSRLMTTAGTYYSSGPPRENAFMKMTGVKRNGAARRGEKMRTKEERKADHERREAARKATYARRMDEIHAKADERKARAAAIPTFRDLQDPSKAEEKRAAQDATYAARGQELLALGGTCKGRYRYHADGTVTYNDSATDAAKKDRVVGTLHDGWEAAYELSARGPTAFRCSASASTDPAVGDGPGAFPVRP